MAMEVKALEVLLLDTTEKEGEDNRLLHVCEHGVSQPSRWSELRGVFAAAMGTMTSVVGEPLATAHFVSGERDAKPTVVGFVDMNEVLFVVVFVECALPTRIVDYYTRSSCELLVSLLGYPHQRLSEWRARHPQSASKTLEHRVSRICQQILQCIRRDFRWETQLQFAFDGCVPTVTYPLETMARLSAFQVIEPRAESHEVAGFVLFYRRMLVAAKTRPDIAKLVSQWLLFDDFDTEAEGGDGASLVVFRWFDAHYALHGVFPALHSLVRIRHGDLQCFYLLRHTSTDAAAPLIQNPSALISTEDLTELLHFADTRLQRHYDTSLATRRLDLVPNKPIWYCVVIDKLRHVLHGLRPRELFESSNDEVNNHWVALLEHLVERPSTVFQRSRKFPPAKDAADRPSRAKPWAPRTKLDFDDESKLLLRPTRTEDDAGSDLSSQDAQIFPPVHHQLEREAHAAERMYPGGELHQEFERLRLDDGRVACVIANYYEVFDLFAVCDDGVSMAVLEQEMDTLLRVE